MTKFNVGDVVSIKGQAHSKLTITEVGTGYFSGYYYAKGAFGKAQKYSSNKLIPYGENTGPESPMGSKPSNPDIGRSSYGNGRDAKH